MTLIDLKLICSEWKDSEEDFAKIVDSACNVLGVYRRELASEFEVAESTVSRWANGVARPLPRMQKLIVTSISKRVNQALKSRVGGSSSSSSGGQKEPMSASSR